MHDLHALAYGSISSLPPFILNVYLPNPNVAILLPEKQDRPKSEWPQVNESGHYGSKENNNAWVTGSASDRLN
jgi:hypothetical protein